MMRRFLHILFAVAALTFAVPADIQAQEVANQGLEFSTRTHNFGKISVSEGPKHCTFEFKNTSGKPIVINNVISSCGCTEPKWPKKPIMPGEEGKIEVTYLNDQGPYPFDKSITVYTSASTKPVILRISGLAYENERSMKEMFPVQLGLLAVKNNVIRGGQINQGNTKRGNFTIANLTGKDVKLAWGKMSPGLELSLPEGGIVKGNSIADIEWKIDTRNKENWGNTKYSAEVLYNGTKAPVAIEVEAMIVDNFQSLTKEEKNKASMVLAEKSSYNFGTVKKGSTVTATFNLRNTGHSPLVIHKVEHPADIKVNVPASIPAGGKFTLEAKTTSPVKKDEVIYTITLITNSPNRPLVNLFIVGNTN